MATEHKNPLYFIIEILEDSIIEKTWEKFKIENTKFEQFYDYDINETTKTISKEPYNGPPESIELRFQDYFLPKLEIRISESSKTLADLHLNEPIKYKKLVKEILDYKERLKEFESDGLQFVDYMFDKLKRKLLHFDGRIFLEAKSIKKDSEKGEKDLTKKSEKSTRTENNHKDYRRYVSILKENPNYNTFPSKAIEETAIEVNKSTKTINRAIAFVELDNLS